MQDKGKKFGAFEGVFTPTILTILGVIMYLRLGWVVGNAGFGGALIIILLAKVVTITTGLSIASIATNVKVGAGGSYALISRSLGAEVGSAVGIPLYLSQSLGGAMYITGFTEGWLAIFPHHSPLLVSSSVLLALFILSLISAKIAMKVQFIIMAVVTGSLISFFLGKDTSPAEITLWGSFESLPFWAVFAIFFPAVTGIEAGAAMSGDVKDSRKALPAGILSAIFISMIVYIAVAYWLDHIASPEQLRSNYTIMIDLSRWSFLIVAGILGATLSSALGSIVGAPRTLMALGQDKVIPFFRTFASQSKNGEPRYSIIFTAVVIEISLILGDLNSIAPLLTMFFLITYGTLNTVVAIEKGLGIPSFRPTFRVPIGVPIIGSLWCLVIMFLINPVFAAVSMVFILIFYLIQVKRGLRSPWGDVRSAVFNAIAEWSAKTTARLPKHAKSWKPNLMIPIEDPRNWTHLMEFIKDIIFPSGTLRLFSVRVLEQGVQQKIHGLVERWFKQKDRSEVNPESPADEMETALNQLAAPIRSEDVFTTAMVIECHHFIEGISIITQVLHDMYFPPNIIFLTMSPDPAKDRRLEEMITIGIREQMGIAVLSLHPKTAFGKMKTINVWLRMKSPNKDLALLMAFQLQRNWNGHIQILSIVEDTEEQRTAERIMTRIIDRARIPVGTSISITVGKFKEALKDASPADINIFGMSEILDCDIMHELADLSNTTCLFVKDSGEENVLV